MQVLHRFNFPAKASGFECKTKTMKPLAISQLVVPSPIGDLLVSANQDALTRLEILLPGNEIEIQPALGNSGHLLKAAAEQLSEYFSGKRLAFDLPLQIRGTQFQEAVWREISEIPFGQQQTYGQIAKNIDNPVASRAVGAAVGANWLPILIPCHRVLGSSRKITGYSGGQGLPTKRWLLDFEGIEYLD